MAATRQERARTTAWVFVGLAFLIFLGVVIPSMFAGRGLFVVVGSIVALVVLVFALWAARIGFTAESGTEPPARFTRKAPGAEHDAGGPIDWEPGHIREDEANWRYARGGEPERKPGSDEGKE